LPVPGDCCIEPGAGDGLSPYEQFVQSYARVREQLFAYVFSLLPNWSDAEDVFQQTSLVLWRKFGEFEQGTNFLAWACRVALFEVRNFQRVASRNRLRFDETLVEQLAQERVVSGQTNTRRRDLLHDCIDKLSDDQRSLLLRTFEEETSVRQLAHELHRAPQTLYNRLNSIRRALFDCVEAALGRQEALP
jgi:RNA polymerase sigma-70 factor, ECF subfamily